jgi:hypothetical protein
MMTFTFFFYASLFFLSLTIFVLQSSIIIRLNACAPSFLQTQGHNVETDLEATLASCPIPV